MDSTYYIQPGLYRHYKGREYDVLGVGQHTETNEVVVIYRPTYQSEVAYWVRPYAMFTDSVVVNGETVRRFTKLDTHE
jgi:hypothetical protein